MTRHRVRVDLVAVSGHDRDAPMGLCSWWLTKVADHEGPYGVSMAGTDVGVNDQAAEPAQQRPQVRSGAAVPGDSCARDRGAALSASPSGEAANPGHTGSVTYVPVVLAAVTAGTCRRTARTGTGSSSIGATAAWMSRSRLPVKNAAPHPDTRTSYQRPPLRSSLLPRAWPGPLSPT